MKPFTRDTESTKVIVQNWVPLTDTEITEAFKGNEAAQWWRALVQIIEGYRDGTLDNAAEACRVNNPLSLSANTGGHKALTELLSDLEARVATKKDKD